MTNLTEIEQHYKAAWEETFTGMAFRYIPEQQKHIFKAMQTYAEYYAKKCLEKAADVCVVDFIETFPDIEAFLIRDSITDIELPKHI